MYLYALGLNKTLMSTDDISVIRNGTFMRGQFLTQFNGMYLYLDRIPIMFTGMSGRVVINQYGSRNPTIVVSQYNTSGLSQFWMNIYRDQNEDWVCYRNNTSYTLTQWKNIKYYANFDKSCFDFYQKYKRYVTVLIVNLRH